MLRSDNGDEYKDEEFLKFCKDAGIKSLFIMKKTPQQNEIAEKMNYTIMDRVRSIRFHVGLAKTF